MNPNFTARSSPSYLIQTPYSYYFRIRIPDDLRLHFNGKTEIKRSLQTGLLSDAKYKARLIAGQVQRMFRYLHGKEINPMTAKKYSKFTDDLLNEIISKYVQGNMNGFEEHMLEVKRPLTIEKLENMQWGYWYVRSEAKEALSTCDYKFISDDADRILKREGIKNLNAHDYKKLCRELLKAQVDFLGRLEKQVSGDYETGQAVSITSSSMTAPVPDLPTDTLQQAVSDYWEEYGQNLKQRTKDAYQEYMKHILKHFGSKTQLHTIDYMKVKAFRDGLRSGDLSLSGEPLSPTRINNYITLVRKVYGLAMNKDVSLKRNPAENLNRVLDKTRPDEKRDIFTTEDLELLFIKSKEYGKNRHLHSHTFWVPLIALYTGARLEEICQLLLTDIVEIDGIWCLDIKESDAPYIKSVKNSRQRIVPLHPFLVDDLNFIKFVKSVKPRSKNSRVFPKLNRIKGRWGHGPGQWFGKFKKRAGIEAEKSKKVFHSFRHTFIDFHKQQGRDMKYAKEVVGHSTGDITTGRYGKPFGPKILFDQVISKTDYPIDLSHLKKSKFVPR